VDRIGFSESIPRIEGPDSIRNQLIGLYGEPMTAVIETVFLSDLQSLANFNAYKKQAALVKKLKKACGVQCKKIK